MRRVLTLAAAAVLTIVMALPAQAENAHFVPSAWTGTLDPTTGVVRVGYQVAGLGPRTDGYVRMRGTVTVDADCYKKRGGTIGHFQYNQNQVAEHSFITDAKGQFKEKNLTLSPASICPPGTYMANATYLWSSLRMVLWDTATPGSEAEAADIFYFYCSGNACGY